MSPRHRTDTSQDRQTYAAEVIQSGRFEVLLQALERDEVDRAQLVERLRTAHLELELQAAELRESQVRTAVALQSFRTLFHMLPVPVWVLGETGRIEQSNVRAREWFAASLEGNQLVDYLPNAEDRVRLSGQFGGRLSSGARALQGIRLAGLDGAVATGDLMLQRVAGVAFDHSIAAVFIDRTVEIERERVLDVALAKANEGSRAKSVFLRSISHELRTPLNAVVGLAQLLKMHLERGTGVEVQQILKWASHMLDAGHHLTELVTTLLDLQAIEAGRLKVTLGPVDLGAVVQQAVSMTEARFQHHGVSLEPPAGLCVPGVQADENRVRQVLINLLDNAAKYTPRGRGVRVEAAGYEGGLRVSVTDEGPGLSLDQQSQLYQAFNRLGAESGGIDGLGLGLAISRQLMEAMGGRIGCVSAPGQGATFWFWLPAQPACAADPAPVPQVE